ncbi:hypothetical protein HNS38_18845 [Lentimicrobium sp. L6]|uniref:hypothetical protein n=1 Tax=Lentimicrobium sp. L6 TaxID=2735916 RepID=UPI001557940F|nr:hypothetical protein [Lentimicrobium sp. L6]NPD86828.1 hypothetical protein [Lentimicrobium sp. L6]
MTYDSMLDAVFNTLSITPTEHERSFADSVINGGKSDPTEKTAMLCTYFEKDSEDNKKAIYGLITTHWH